MNEPPDPGDFVPPAGQFVTIQSNESGMDTDGSTSTRSLKRSRISVCKHCNKRRRRHHGSDTVSCGCQDAHLNENEQKVINTDTTNKIIDTVQTITSQSPSTPVGRNTYDKTDCAPYIIHVQKQTLSQNDGTTLHPITFGKFLKKNNIPNIINGSVKRIGRNKISLAFSNFADANSFINNGNLEAEQLKAYIPTFNVTRMGLVRGVPAEWSPEEIVNNISVPIGCGPILKVRRLNFKTVIEGSVVWKPTQSIVITFDGQVLPKRIFMCYNALPVDLYIFPTIQCFHCCRYGHTKVQCRSKPRCFKCGQNHTGDTCNRDKDPSCCMCSGYHFATSKSCPEFSRQKQIKTYMAQNSVSYAEALKVHPPVSRTYAETLLSSPSNNFSSKPALPSFNRIPNNIDSPTTSHKKTTFLKPRSPPRPSYGYDKNSHNALIQEYNAPQPANGCALRKVEDSETNNLSTNDFITALIQLLSQYNISPSNVASYLNLFSLPINNGQTLQNNAVELPQPDKQKK